MLRHSSTQGSNSPSLECGLCYTKSIHGCNLKCGHSLCFECAFGLCLGEDTIRCWCEFETTLRQLGLFEPCVKHKKICEYVCRDCKVFVCSDCLLKQGHKDHKRIEFEEKKTDPQSETKERHGVPHSETKERHSAAGINNPTPQDNMKAPVTAGIHDSIFVSRVSKEFINEPHVERQQQPPQPQPNSTSSSRSNATPPVPSQSPPVNLFTPPAPKKEIKKDLIAAAESGDFEVFRGLSSAERENLDKHRDIDGNTPLLIAVKLGNIPLTELLLKLGANPDVANEFGCLPLHFAAASGKLDLLKIVRAAAPYQNVNARAKNGWTAIFISLHEDADDISSFLIDSGVDVMLRVDTDKHPLPPTSLTNKGDEKNAAVESKIKKKKVNDRGPNGNTELMSAVCRGDIEELLLLLSFGADADIANNDGWLPLHFACAQSDLRVLKLIWMTTTSRIDVRTNHGETPFHIAARYVNLDFLPYLVKNGADADAQDLKGRTAAHMTVETLTKPKYTVEGREMSRRANDILSVQASLHFSNSSWNVICDACGRDNIQQSSAIYRCVDCLGKAATLAGYQNYDLCQECVKGPAHRHHSFVAVRDQFAIITSPL